jgi:hypothetical protein
MLATRLKNRMTEIERLTAQMLEVARAQDWPRLTELEERRQSALAALFAEPVEARFGAALAEGIRRVLAADRELMTHGEAGRREAASALSGLERGRRGVAAYRSIETG